MLILSINPHPVSLSPVFVVCPLFPRLYSTVRYQTGLWCTSKWKTSFSEKLWLHDNQSPANMFPLGSCSSTGSLIIQMFVITSQCNLLKSDSLSSSLQLAVGIVSRWILMATPHVPFTIWRKSLPNWTHRNLPTTTDVSYWYFYSGQQASVRRQWLPYVLSYSRPISAAKTFSFIYGCRVFELAPSSSPCVISFVSFIFSPYSLSG